MLFGELAPPAQVLEGSLQFFGQVLKHNSDRFLISFSRISANARECTGMRRLPMPLEQHLVRYNRAAVAKEVQQVPRSRRSEEHTSELQSRLHLVCRLLLEKKKRTNTYRVVFKQW